MKTIILSLGFMVAGSAAVKLEGIPKTAIMQAQPNHWRKAWPEGATDNADGDDEVLGMFLKDRTKKKKPVVTYPWNYDEDVIGTGASLETAEKLVGKKLTPPKDGGLGMIFTYDNTAVQNTLLRDGVMGPHEYAGAMASAAADKLTNNGKDDAVKMDDHRRADKGYQYEMKYD